MGNTDTKVNILDGNCINRRSRCLSPTLSSAQRQWLNQVCLHISQKDFDTCRDDYNDYTYDVRNGYNQQYNKYLWEFENC